MLITILQHLCYDMKRDRKWSAYIVISWVHMYLY